MRLRICNARRTIPVHFLRQPIQGPERRVERQDADILAFKDVVFFPKLTLPKKTGVKIRQ
jgi:hypothetical protein